VAARDRFAPATAVVRCPACCGVARIVIRRATPWRHEGIDIMAPLVPRCWLPPMGSSSAIGRPDRRHRAWVLGAAAGYTTPCVRPVCVWGGVSAGDAGAVGNTGNAGRLSLRLEAIDPYPVLLAATTQ
jgi:hypothetical protein